MKYNLMNDTSVIDPDIHNVLLSELERGRNGLEMIASENYAAVKQSCKLLGQF